MDYQVISLKRSGYYGFRADIQAFGQKGYIIQSTTGTDDDVVVIMEKKA